MAFNLTELGLLLGVPHVIAVYFAAYVWNLPYTSVLAINAITAVVTGLLAKGFFPFWKQQFMGAISADKRAGDLTRDALGMLAVLIVSASISATIVYRKFGLGGYAGLLAANGLINVLFG